MRTLLYIISSIICFLVAIIFIFALYRVALSSKPLTEFNTVLAPDFNVQVWEEKVVPGMKREDVRNLIGFPLTIHEPTRCDFYSKSKIKWLNFNEYKVCYDENEVFFLKLKFERPEKALIDG